MKPRMIITAAARFGLAAALSVGAAASVSSVAHAENATNAATANAMYLQLGSFRNEANARRLLEQFVSRPNLVGTVQGFVEPRVVGAATYHRVRVGPIFTDGHAAQAITEARAMGISDAQLRRAPIQPSVAAVQPQVSDTANLATASTPVVVPGQAIATTVRYLQVGSFTNLNSATTLLGRARAIDSNIDGVIHSVGRRGGAYHRVLIGPFDSDQAASNAKVRLQQLGVLVPVAPQPAPNTSAMIAPVTSTQVIETASIPAPATASSITAIDAAKMPYLNVGAYRVPTNAHQALDRLRRSGMDNGAFGRGFIDSVTTSRGETLWRVRFGPISTEDRANQALSLAQIMGYRDARIAEPKR